MLGYYRNGKRETRESYRIACKAFGVRSRSIEAQRALKTKGGLTLVSGDVWTLIEAPRQTRDASGRMMPVRARIEFEAHTPSLDHVWHVPKAALDDAGPVEHSVTPLARWYLAHGLVSALLVAFMLYGLALLGAGAKLRRNPRYKTPMPATPKPVRSLSTYHAFGGFRHAR